MELCDGQIGEEVTSTCSPFGISSKEVFHQLTYRGIIANYLGRQGHVGILDLEGSDGLLNVEGSPVLS